MTLFDNMSAAFTPFSEDLVWKQKRSPKKTAVVSGCVFHGRKEIEAYQSVNTGIVKRYSDTWTVMIDEDVAMAAEISQGDTLTRQTPDSKPLYVQSITKEDGSWIVSASTTEAIG